MKKIFTLKAIIFAMIIVGHEGYAQCSPIPAPTVSGNTLAACVSSGIFTLTASSSTNTTYWITAGSGSLVSTNSVFVTPSINSSATYYAAQGNGAASASLNLPAYASAWTGVSRGWTFQAPASFMITGVRVPTDVGTGNSSIAIMLFPAIPPNFPTLTSTYTLLASFTNTPDLGNIIPINISVNNGDVIGVLGCRDVSGTPNTSYSGATSPYATTFGPYSISLLRMGMQFPLPTNMPPHDMWTESGGTVARVELYTTLGCLSPMTPVTVSVSPAPQITLSGPPTGSICLGDSVVLSGSGIPFTWQVPGSPSTPTLMVSPSSTSIYFANGVISPTCTASASITVNVNPNPAVYIAANQPVICMGNGVSLSAGGALSYQWNGGPATANYSVNGLTTYTVFSVTGTDNVGCHTTSTIDIGVLDVQVNVSMSIPSATICAGTSVTLTAAGCDSYVWSANNPPQAEIVVSPNISTNYIVTGTTYTTGGVSCSATNSININVLPNPPISALSSKTIVCKGEPLTLIAGGNAANYLWNGLNLITKVISITPSVVAVTVYTVTGTANNGCDRTATVQVIVDACTGINEQQTSADNLFVYPNPSNGEFTVEMNNSTFEKNLKLFDLTGRVLMTRATTEQKIDFNINELSKGFYYLQVQSGSDKHTIKVVKE